MKLLVYALILGAVLLIPNRGTDVGKLIPVEVIAISESNETVTVRTDTGDLGQGETLEDAFRDLEATAAGLIYLDTAEYVLMEEEIGEIGKYLKGNTRVYYAAEGISLEGIAAYLSVHQSGTRLKELANGAGIPRVCEENGRYWLASEVYQKKIN